MRVISVTQGQVPIEEVYWKEHGDIGVLSVISYTKHINMTYGGTTDLQSKETMVHVYLWEEDEQPERRGGTDGYTDVTVEVPRSWYLISGEGRKYNTFLTFVRGDYEETLLWRQAGGSTP